MTKQQQIENVLKRVRDQKTFIQDLLAETLDWHVPEGVEKIEDLGYDWSLKELNAEGLDKHIVSGSVLQVQLAGDQPWGGLPAGVQESAGF